MQDTYIHIRTNKQTKEEAQKVAEEFGFSLSDLINAYLKQVARDQQVAFSLKKQTSSLDKFQLLTQQEVLAMIKNAAEPILKKAGVKKAALFGSYARGEQTKTSDIDIIIDLPNGKTLLDLVGLQIELEEKLNKKVDLVEYGGLKPRISPSIMEQQIPLI